MQSSGKTTDAPGSGQKWRRKKVCKSCHWLRKIDCAGDGWDGKCCTYTYNTVRGMSVITPDFEANREILKETLAPEG